MREDSRAEALTRNFVGQWLRYATSRDSRSTRGPCSGRTGKHGSGSISTPSLRRAMTRETEMLFGISPTKIELLELIDCDYTFLNARLAALYGIKGVSGKEMRKVSFPRTAPAAACWPCVDFVGHVQSDADLAGEARAVHPRQHPGDACAAAAAEHPRL